MTFGVDGARWDARDSRAKPGGVRSTNGRCEASELGLTVIGDLGAREVVRNDSRMMRGLGEIGVSGKIIDGEGRREA